MLSVLVGGARSGKSSLAVEVARRSGRSVTFIATAEPFDDDLARRIERHRDERPDWPTIEAPLDLAGAVARTAPGSFAIVDCLTVWMGNLFHHEPSPEAREERVAAFEMVLQERRHDTDLVLVTNEVGMGLHPDTSPGREYRDELGRLNQRIAARADRTLLLVAGRAVELHDPWTVWS